MKPFLGVNVTLDAENTVQDGSEFLIEKTPDVLSQNSTMLQKA